MMFGKLLRPVLWVGALLVPALLFASGVLPDLEEMRSADVVFLGEQHDNRHHHTLQADYVRKLQPKTVVFEMLTPEQAKKVTAELVKDQDALEATLGWNASGWPDFDMYYPIFAAAANAQIKGAGVPREALREVMAAGLSSAIGPDNARRFGLDQPLPSDQQKARETLQKESHCNALPEEMLPGMVDVQRFRDAMLAKAALEGLQENGGPVVVITGNGHARPDWGAPFIVSNAAPELNIVALGQGEDGSAPSGGFEFVSDAPSVDRGDPCDAFRK